MMSHPNVVLFDVRVGQLTLVRLVAGNPKSKSPPLPTAGIGWGTRKVLGSRHFGAGPCTTSTRSLGRMRWANAARTWSADISE
jgi:hypothetical protein